MNFRLSKKIFFFIFCLSTLFSLKLSALEHFDTVGVLVAVDRHIISLRKGKFDKAYGLTSFEFRYNTTLDEFMQFVEERPVLNDNQSIALGKLLINDKIAYYEGILCSRSGEEMQVNYDLIKDGPDWKIERMAVSEMGAEKIEVQAEKPASCLKCRNASCQRGERSLLKAFMAHFFGKE